MEDLKDIPENIIVSLDTVQCGISKGEPSPRILYVRATLKSSGCSVKDQVIFRGLKICSSTN